MSPRNVIVKLEECPKKGSFVLGIDVGTTSVKTCLCHTDSGKIVQPNWLATKASLPDPDRVARANVQDPFKIFHAVQTCVRQYPSTMLSRVARITICGQMHGIVFWRSGRAWDTDGSKIDPRFVSMLYTWQDGRCTSDFINSLPPAPSGIRLASGYGLVTLLWFLRNGPDSIVEKSVPLVSSRTISKVTLVKVFHHIENFL